MNQRIEFIESYRKIGNDYQWSDNHGELVRCKDCKEWDEEKHWCNIRDSYGWDYKPNDYCSYGVRKAGK